MDKYGLIGYPLGHSFSISYFNEKFQNEGIDAVYENYEIPDIDNLPEILDSNPELRGLNVTIPYKQQVIKYLDALSPEAQAIGAVNVIKVTHKDRKTILKGYNSDVIGFTRSIEALIEPCHKKALILGTGGASKAVRPATPERTRRSCSVTARPWCCRWGWRRCLSAGLLRRMPSPTIR